MYKLIRYWKMLFVPVSLVFISAIFTGAYFSSSVSSSGNTFSSGNWVMPTPTPTPIPNPAQGVVISELMWMGSVAGDSNDEWIELRNTTSSTIDLSDWKITKVASNGSGVESLMLTIPAGNSIGPNGYFLISNYNKADSVINVDPNLVNSGVTLGNSYLKIRLYSGDWSNPSNLIDTAGNGGVPLAGSNGANKGSMSRNSTPGDGTVIGSWFTDTTHNSAPYWDDISGAGNNYGTPGDTNV